MPFFSIIIPLYNKEKFIENTLKSVLNQTFTDYEVLIVNDGSTDNSLGRVLQFNDSRIKHFNKENGGVSTARNYGIKEAKSDYIAFIDADDYWYPDFLQEIFQNITHFPEHKVFTVAIEIETPNNTIPAVYSIEKSKNQDCKIVDYFDASNKESVIWTSSAVFHKSIFKVIGDFDVNLKSGQDTDLWIRIGLKYPIVFSWKIAARYVYDRDSLSKKKEYIATKMDFSKFSGLEKTNPMLKKFLDLNRFSFAIKCKLYNDRDSFNRFYNGIDCKNLSVKKRILLKLPSFLLKLLVPVNLFLVRIGLNNSVFK